MNVLRHKDKKKSTSPSTSFAIVEISLNSNKIFIKTNINGQTKTQQIFHPQANKENLTINDNIYYLLLIALRDVFFSLPLSFINILCDPIIQRNRPYLFFRLINLFKATNTKIIQYQEKINPQASKKNILALNANNSNRFNKLIDVIKTKTDRHIFSKNFDMNFSPYDRQWNEKQIKYQPILDNIITFILENQVNQVILLNFYYIKFCFDTCMVYLPALFLKLGITYNTIDIDNYDLSENGYLEKKFFNNSNSQRYTTCAPNELWDRVFNIKTNYIAVPNKMKQETYVNFYTKKQAKIIRIFSHCRLGSVTGFFSKTLYLLEQLIRIDTHNLNISFQLWYITLRQLIIDSNHIPLVNRIKCNYILYNLAYAMSQFIKYIFINEIDPFLIDENIQVEIYGDTHWNLLFPQYYQNKYLNNFELNHLLDQNDGINLLFNWCPYGVCSSSGQFSDLISNNRSFLCLSTPILSPYLSPLKNIMCNNKEDLNKKIKNFKDIYNNKQLLKALECTKKFFFKNTSATANSLLNQKKINYIEDEYSLLRETERNMTTQVINDFSSKHRALITKSFEILFIPANTLRVKESRFYDLPFVNSILSAYQGKHNF